MATASIATLALVDNPSIYHGFWHSFGTTFPRGPVLTVSTPVYAFLTSGIALYMAWIISCVWRILDFLIFKTIHERTKTSLEESQCAALIVNSGAPLGAFVTAGQLLRRGGPRDTLTKIVLGALVVISLKAAIPFLVAIFPTHREGLIASSDCGYLPHDINSTGWGNAVTLRNFSDAALSSTGQSRMQPTKDRKAATLAPLPNPTQSYVLTCPSRATCHPDYPFNFSSVYTLTSRHLGLNINTPFSLQVSDTCYRPIDAMSLYDNSTNPTVLGLYYGPNDPTQNTDYTDIVFAEQAFAPGYALDSFSALTDDLYDSNIWIPNSTLTLGGDTTILFYFIGFVEETQPNNDPIFATLNATNGTAVGSFYYAINLVSPIVCDTKYQLCANGGYDCSPNGPMSHVVNWINTKSGDVWDDIYTLFSGSTFQPPIMAASQGSGAIAASQTLVGSFVQTDPATVVRELGRLSRAGMTMLASGTQLAALGYWDLGQGSDWTPKHQLCRNVVIQSTTAVSVLITPYLILFSISFIIVIISYLDLLGVGMWGEYADLWALYSVGHLHRQVVEQHYGKVSDAKSGKKWPSMTSNNVGFDVVERDGSKYFTPSSPTTSQWANSPTTPRLSATIPTLQYPYTVETAHPVQPMNNEFSPREANHTNAEIVSIPTMNIPYVGAPPQTPDNTSRRGLDHFDPPTHGVLADTNHSARTSHHYDPYAP